MKQYLLSRLTRMPLLILLALVGLAGTARGATSLQFFFPIDNDLANTIDDEIVVKPVAWSSASQPVNWVLLKPNNSSVLVPTFNTNNISDAEVLTALEAALTEWNNGGLSSFTFEDDVLFSTSVAVPNPRPTDAGLDTHNLMTFQSQLVTLESGAIAETSIYFMERDFDLQAFMGMPIDNIEPGVVLPFDLNGDGFADVSLPARNYKQAEIIETDIIFNSSLIYYQWPANRSDIPSTQLPFLLGSNDIQSTMVHELGHAHGLGHSYIEASTMYPFLNDVTADFPSDPYDVRQIAYDDKLGAGLIYPNFSGTGGEIRGWVIDGQAIDIFDALPQPLDLDNVDPAVNDSLFVVEAPVFLGVPAPPGLHPDNVASAEGVIRLIAQVTSGQSLRYPAGSGGVVDLEPSLTTDPNIDFADNGEDADQDGILDVGEDLNANGVLDPTTRKIDSKFRFAGLAPRDDYAIYIDQDVLGLGEPIAISPAFNFLGGLESFPAEFYGGVTSSSSKIDDATGDDPQELEFISVAGGAITNNIIVITNTDTTSGGGGGDDGTTPDGSATPPLKFVEDPLAIGNTDYVALGSDIGDLNGDGYLDIVVAVFSGGSDVGGGKFNRVYLNVPANPSDPKSKRFFKDITFGADGVPGTTDDILPANSENSRDCKLGDFNNDGRLDLFVVNAADQNSLPGYGGFNRLYTNEEDSGNIYGFRFRDVSQSTMPGLLNRGWDPSTSPVAAPGLFADGRSDGYHAAVGDIDGDGDLDIVVSLFTPATDATSWTNGRPDDATAAMIDTQPNANGSPGDAILTPFPFGTLQPDQITASCRANGFATTLFFTSGTLGLNAGPLVFSEQVLMNHFYDSTDPGFKFVDETLGADNRFGDSTHTVISDGTGFEGILNFTPNSDRMPPVFPATFNFSATFGSSNIADSPMAYAAVEPRLGPIYVDTGLDLVSVRAFTDLSISTRADNFGQSAFFENIDVNDDGRPDGYFACTNYNFDYHIRSGSGLFPIHVVNGGTTITIENTPLLIGLPDGTPGDINGAPFTSELNIYEVVNRAGFTGVIGDWEYRGAPKPLILHDTNFGVPAVYRPFDAGGSPTLYFQADGGARRGQDGFVTGNGISYYPTGPGTYGLFMIPPVPSSATILRRDLPALPGEAHGSTVADFDNDGDLDVAVANTVINGFLNNGVEIVTDFPATNTLLTNNGFGVFSNATASAFPSTTARISHGVLAGDIDNDGDNDLVFLDSLSGHQILLNQDYDPNKSPDLDSNSDATMFYDQSPEFLPPLFDTALRPPDGAFAFTGITTSAAAADFNGDGLMDLTTAEGGLFSMGDYPQFFFNSGPPRQEPFRPFNEGLTIFKPIGSGVPARFILPPLASSSFQPAEGGINAPRILNGYIGEEIGAYYGVSVGDFSGDGYPDLFYTRDGQGPISFLNVDGSVAVGLIGGGETTINSFPDSDINPDGVFVGLNQISGLPGFPMLLPDLTDPCPDPSGSIVLKKMNRRMAAADFDGNGKLDVCIANGIQGSGAPNVLLLNSPVMVFPFPVPFPWFTDATESNLPTVLGDCGMPTGIMDDTYDVAAADFDHDGDIDIVFANQSNTSLTLAFPGFRYLANDGTGVFTDTNASLGNIPEFLNTKPRALIIGDFDGVGEWTEDLNGNGILDAGEDTNGNGILDRSEDVNGNGILDPGEDLNGNGVLDFVDLPDETVAGDVNGDGIITKRTAGVWEPSFDIFVCFADRTNAILINDPTNQTPGIFADQSTIRLPAFPLDGSMALQSGGGRACDLDKDGKLDILVAKQTFNAFMRPVQYLHNDGGGFFSDKSYEFPFPTSVRGFGESGPTSISYTGNASDVEVLDVDNDGDLDVYVGMAGRGESLQTIGAMDVMYINRLNGGNFNTGALTLPPTTPPPLAKPPLVFAVNPGSAVQGSVNLNVDVIGTRFEFTPTTTLNFGAGITVNSVTFVDANHLVANITISPTAQVGPRSVSVQNPSNGLSSSTVSGIFNVADDTSGNAVALKEWIRYE